MSKLNELAEQLESKGQQWIIVYRICQALIMLNALLFGLYLLTPITTPFELIFGSTPANLWFSIAICFAITMVLSTAYHRSNGYHELAEQARGKAK